MSTHAALRGFTIIELMTVMVVAAILLVLAAPAFNDMLERRRVEGRANELVTDLAYAKSESVQRNRNVVLITGGSGTCYTIAAWTAPVASRTGSCNCANGAGASCTPALPSGTDPTELKTVTLSNSVVVTSEVTFDFEPLRGALQPPATAASAVVSLDSRTYTVTVNANGRVAPFAP
jgi:type IV fimbrial biogenesis protein FimT